MMERAELSHGYSLGTVLSSSDDNDNNADNDNNDDNILFDTDEWVVMHCSVRMDEIWVPTEWHKELFTR